MEGKSENLEQKLCMWKEMLNDPKSTSAQGMIKGYEMKDKGEPVIESTYRCDKCDGYDIKCKGYGI